MIDPQLVEAAFRTSTSRAGGIVPTADPTHVKPIPTVTTGPTATATPVPFHPIFEEAGRTGSTTLWVVFGVMLISTLVFTFLAYRIPVQKRLFHVLTTFIAVFSTLSYFAMATRTGSTYAHFVYHETLKHTHYPLTEHIFRQVFWVRSVDSALTTTLILLNLSFLAGLNGSNILVAVVADLIMVVAGLFATFGHHHASKWGWYAIAAVAYLVIVYQLVIPGRRTVKAKADSQTGKLYAAISGYTIVLWALYAVVLGITGGTRRWSVDAEIIAYAVLDILAKPVFGFWLIFAHGKKILAIDGFWTHGLAAEGAVRLEDDEA